ncbi:MAG: anaerobic sulfatase maturase [Actinomycetia bacterium]|nr:anaerobic sulfatase maturase [Actinomycetes bacterium]MCP4959835.1 anaerobic sulfatase maturase [Actinomycetes bacterium]
MHLLAKPSGAICNLNCTYCFFLSKELLYPGDRFRMDDETLEAYVRQTIESQQIDEITIAWQGGEPTLMGVDFIRRSVELARQYLPQGKTIEFSMQTNGTLLDDDWCQFLAENGFLVGLSVDGPPAMHDAYRVDKQNRGTSGRVLAAYELLKRHEVDVNILCTVNAANQDHPVEVYRYFRDELGADFLQFIPIVERASEVTLEIANKGWAGGRKGRPLYVNKGSMTTERSVGAAQWGRFLCAVFDEWVRNDVGDVFVQYFDAALVSWLGMGSAMCIFAETCGAAPVLEHNGDLYSCDHFVEPEHKLGNINETHMLELLATPQQHKFGNGKRDMLPQYCLDCEVRFACHGECPRNRFISSPDGEPGLNYLCEGYKAFFSHIDEPIRLMADILRRGGIAPEVMDILAERDRARFVGVGRNDPCPCGSGQKFKRCHA